MQAMMRRAVKYYADEILYRRAKINDSLRHLTRDYSIETRTELIISLYRKKKYFGLAYIKKSSCINFQPETH